MSVGDDWFLLEMPPGTDVDLPGVFAWVIDGTVAYVGRATPLRGRWGAYERNIDHLRDERDYRPEDPESFRAVHQALKEARERRATIRFRVIEAVLPGTADLNERKRHWVAELRPELNGRPRLGGRT